MVSIVPSSSVTERVTVCMPSSKKVKLGSWSVLVPKPSKSQSHDRILSGYDVDVSVKSTGEPSS